MKDMHFKGRSNTQSEYGTLRTQMNCILFMAANEYFLRCLSFTIRDIYRKEKINL
jgi:hypothetical protein